MRVFAVLNDTGATWPSFAVAQLITDVSGKIDPGDATPVFSIALPGKGAGQWVVNGAVPLRNQYVGEAIHMYDTAHVRIKEDEVPVPGQTVGPVPDSFFCSLHGSGLEVLGGQEVLAVIPVFHAAPRTVFVIMKDNLAPADKALTVPSTADAYMVYWDSVGNLAASNDIIRITNRYENIEVEAGTFGEASERGLEWHLTGIDCAPMEDAV